MSLQTQSVGCDMRWFWIGAAILAVVIVCFGGNIVVLGILLQLYAGWLGLILLLCVLAAYWFFRRKR